MVESVTACPVSALATPRFLRHTNLPLLISATDIPGISANFIICGMSFSRRSILVFSDKGLCVIGEIVCDRVNE
jgi:hypothetical protein